MAQYNDSYYGPERGSRVYGGESAGRWNSYPINNYAEDFDYNHWGGHSNHSSHSNYPAQHNYEPANYWPQPPYGYESNPPHRSPDRWNYGQRGSSYPRGRGGKNKHQSGHRGPSPPYKKPKTEFAEEKDQGHAKENKTSQNKTANSGAGNNQPQIRTLLKQVQNREPYSRSSHEIQDVWMTGLNIEPSSTIALPDALPNPEVDVAVNNLSENIKQDSSAIVPTVQEMEQDDDVILIPEEEIKRDPDVMIDLTNDDGNDETIPQEKEITVSDNLHDKEIRNVSDIAPSHTQEVSHVVNSIPTKESTSVPGYCGYSTVPENHDRTERIVIRASALDAQDRLLDSLGACITNTSSNSSVNYTRPTGTIQGLPVNIQSNGEKERREPDFSSTNAASVDPSNIENRNSIPTVQDDSVFNGEEESVSSSSSEDSDYENSSESSSSESSSESSDSESLNEENENYTSPLRNSLPLVFNENPESPLAYRDDRAEINSDTDLSDVESSSSDENEDEIFEMSSLPLKRKSQNDDTFCYKKPRTSQENGENCVTSDKAQVNHISNLQTLPAVKSRKRLEVTKPVTSYTEEKRKSITETSVKKSAPVIAKNTLSSSDLSRQGGKRKRIVGSRKLVVLLRRLTPAEIFKFSVPKSIVEKNTLLYQKDSLCQMKYFIRFIEYYCKENYTVSINLEVDNSNDLCNKLLHISKENFSGLINIKYVQKNREHNRITYKTLSNPEFDIKKFYNDFLNFRRSHGKLDEFLIITNMDLNIEVFRSNGIEVNVSENDQFKFTVKEEHELHKKFKKCLTLHKLAEVIVECIEKGKQKNFNTELIKMYHLALVKENIFSVQTKKGPNGKLTDVAKFHKDFIRGQGLSPAAKELRRHVIKIMQSQPKESMEIVLTRDRFGKDTNLDPNPQVDYKEVAEALVYKNPAKLMALKCQLEKIVGHVLEKEENGIFGFSKEFYIGDNLPGNLKTMRWQVLRLCTHHAINFTEFWRSKITIPDFCVDHPVQKLPNEDCKQLFTEFFQCFAFENIRSYTRLLNQDIAAINDEACMNAVQEELLRGFQMGNLDKESFDSIKNLISKCRITKNSYKQSQAMSSIQFDQNVLSALRAKVPNHGIVLITTKSLSLTNLKLKQMSAYLNYIENKEILCIKHKTLLEMTSDVLNALSHKSTHLLVVQWDEPLKNSKQVLDIFEELVELIGNHHEHPMKTIIIIAHQDNCSSATDKIKFTNRIADDGNSFDLSEEARLKLLQADNVYLQNRKLSLVKSNLILDQHVPILLENTEILRRLVAGKLTIGKSLTKPYGYTESFFKTEIKQCIIIDPAIFKKQIDDVFMIRNIERRDLEKYLPSGQRILSPNDVPASIRIHGKFILLGFNIPPSFFDSYVEKNQDYSVHLLRYESEKFVWEKTKGNNKYLLRYRGLDEIDDVLKDQATKYVITEGPKIVIICGQSGSGKSVCLYNLAKETKSLYKTESLDALWPIQVNLNNNRLSEYFEKNRNIAHERDFVPDFLCNYLELDEVQSKLLTMILKNQLKIKLVLFFDNFEELLRAHRQSVIQLLQKLQVSYCEKVYVTSSPSTRTELENALGVFAYTLDFSDVEKIQFLLSFWSKRGDNQSEIAEAGNFIDHYSRTDNSGDDLTTTPLHLRMLVELHDMDDEDDYIAVETRDELYKLYIEHKGVKDEESASIYCLKEFLDEDALKSLGIKHKDHKKDFILVNDLKHRTFYEYFCAKWLARNYSPDVCNCVNDHLNYVSPIFLKTYLAELNKNEDIVKVVNNFAANGHLNVVKMMLLHCKNKLPLTDIIQSNNSNAREVIKLILDNYNDTEDQIMEHGGFKNPKYAESNVVKYVNKKEKKGTPLEVAARLKNIPIACELLLKGADIKRIDKDFVTAIARYIANEMCKTDSTWLHPIAEKLFKLQPEAVTRLSRSEKYPRLLSYFFTHGRVELINLLLKNDRERYKILEAKVDEKSPLDLVNESHDLSDAERLEITKYIASNVGEDLERKNKFYLGDVLRTAAECNHVMTFDYFIGKYPGKQMGFLESAMKSNRLDLMKFLARNTARMMYPDENTALHKAVSLGVSLITIKYLINRGGIDNKNKHGENPLCIAFKEGKEFEFIDYLIKRDASLTDKDNLGLYPWCYVILNDSKYTSEEQMHIMKYLQEERKIKLVAPETEQKINFESDQKRKEVARKLKFFLDPLGFVPNFRLFVNNKAVALQSNDEHWIRFLILHGADVNCKREDGQMPLHIAIEFKRYKLVKMLLDRGAMFNAKDKSKMTPLALLSANGDGSQECKEIKEILETATKLFNGDEKYSSKVSKHLINCRDKQGQTLLHVAAKNGSRNVIRDIVRHWKDHCIKDKDFPALDVNVKDLKDRTPLNVVKSKYVDVEKELLINGAIFESATTSLLQSAAKLLQAVKDKDVGKVKKLINENECLVNARDESGKSCLHWAACFNCREIMEIILLVREADVNVKDLNSQTPLHYAAENDNIACVVLLLKAGASYDMKNKDGFRPFDSTDKTNESLKLMRKIDGMFVDIKSDEPRILVNENPNDALFEYLTEIEETWNVSKDIAVNVVDRNKNTLLHIATKYDFTIVVKNLLMYGAIYNSKNKWKQTPESMAISAKRLYKILNKISQNLHVNSWLQLDPNLVVNFRFNNGSTLLYECVKKGKLEDVRWLIRNNADVHATSSRGNKIKCDRKKYPEIAELLEEQ